MRHLFYILFLACCFLGACKFNPAIQGRGVEFLQGEWAEDSVMFQEQLLEYTKHRFTFRCDSFYASLETHAQINRYPDECFNKGLWKEYAKGTYALKNDTLYLIGTFTKDNFKQKISGCYRTGQYRPVFIVREKSSDRILLESLHQHIPVSLKLKKKTVCIPKEL